MKGDSGKFERCPLKVNQAMVIGDDEDDDFDDDDDDNDAFDDADDADMMMIYNCGVSVCYEKADSLYSKDFVESLLFLGPSDNDDDDDYYDVNRNDDDIKVKAN